MTSLTPWLLAGALLVTGWTGCAAEQDPPSSASSTTFGRAELEREVADRFPPADGRTRVRVRCDGGLKGEVDETQACRVRVGRDPAHVRVSVTAVEDERIEFAATPFVPPTQVARTLHTALNEDGYLVEEVVCVGELIGVVGEQVSCTAAPASDDGLVEATVTAVQGLRIQFDYEVVGRG